MATPTSVASSSNDLASTAEIEYRRRLENAIAGRYRITSVLGRGGMSIVYLARDLRHDRNVAIKVLRPEIASAVGSHRFHREIFIAARLQHPHIVPLYDSGEADGLLYYVMQFVEGESLRDRLNREQLLPVETATRIVANVALALDYAHANDVVHRDIKPENVMLVGETAVVTDFGIARALSAATEDHMTGTGVAIGTPAYMSPEQASGFDSVDGRTDVYALGCVLYEMLVGEPPFVGATPQAVVARHLADRVPSIRAVRETVPAAVEDAVNRALAKTPADRFSKASEFVEALHRTEMAKRSPLGTWSRRTAFFTAAALLVGISYQIFVHPEPRLEPSHVAVFPFQNETGDSTLDHMGGWVASTIQSGINRAEQVPVTIGPPIRTAPAENLRSAARGEVDPFTLARSLGAGTAILGAFYLIADSLQFRAEIVDAREPAKRFPVTPVMAARNADPREAVNLLRQRIMADLWALMTWDEERLDSLGLPERYEAFSTFSRGRNFLFAGDHDAAIDLLLRAAEADTSFKAPLLFAIMTYRVAGQYERADSLARAVNATRATLAPSDRHLLDIERIRLQGNWDSARVLGRIRWESTLREPGHLIDIAVTALPAGYPGETVQAVLDMPAGVRLRYPGSVRLITHGYHLLGNYESELSEARRARDAYGNPAIATPHELRALAALGNTKEVLEFIDRGTQTGPLLTTLALELVAHGHPETAEVALSASLAWHRGSLGTPVEDRLAFVQALYVAGRLEEATEVLAGGFDPDAVAIEVLGYRGTIAARSNRAEEAERVSQRLAAIDDRYTFGKPSRWRARIAALLGDDDQAITLLQRAFHKGLRYSIDLHRDIDFRTLSSDPRFQRLLRPKG